MRRKRPGDRFRFREPECGPEVGMEVAAERELDRVGDRDVGRPAGDAPQEVQGIRRADLGPRQSGCLLRQPCERVGMAGVALHHDAPADQVRRGSG